MILDKENDKIKFLHKLDLSEIPSGTVSRYRLTLTTDGIGDPVQIPLIIAKGILAGPVLGVTAAVHGNEINGLPIIFQFINEINPLKLHGTVIAIPVVNVHGFLQNIRSSYEGADLNRLFPGKKKGTSGQRYVYNFLHRVVKHFDYLIDLHTASFGRANSLYIKADLENEITRKMSYLINPQIVVHSTGKDGTLRSSASTFGIHAITLEVGNPHLFQRSLIKKSVTGLMNILVYLKMVKRKEKTVRGDPIICSRSFWIYSDMGGILEVIPEVASIVNSGDIIAKITNIYGDIIKEYRSTNTNCIVIGKSINPVGEAGSRIIHLGVIDE
mgnify:CR=1 FL=1